MELIRVLHPISHFHEYISEVANTRLYEIPGITGNEISSDAPSPSMRTMLPFIPFFTMAVAELLLWLKSVSATTFIPERRKEES